MGAVMGTLEKDRFRGALLGLALGDALGAPYEFKVPPFDMDPMRFRPGVFGHGPGEGTDDSTLAMFCAEALLEGDLWHGYPRRLVEWVESSPPDVGGQTSIAAMSWAARGEPPDPDEEAQGNGSLMACAPIGLALFHDPNRAEEYARDFAGLTHPSTMARSCNAKFVGWLRQAISGRAVEAHLPPDLGTDPVAGPGSGHCLLTLTLAARTAEMAEEIGPFNALVGLIRLGGDTDTNAAVAGALLGARFGPDAWPDYLLDDLLLADRMIELADGLWASS
jgi:ADP-ribosyl-[dinitrogen reductase] hydrolase